MAALAEDYRSAPVTPAEHAMLGYAVKLTREPWAMAEGDVGALRAAGWDDRAILDINQVASYFAYVNRVADGLGVELEPYWAADEGEEPAD